MNFRDLLQPEVLVFVTAMVAIVTAGITAIVKRLIVHRERMAMIEQGLHPDNPPARTDSADYDVATSRPEVDQEVSFQTGP